MSAEVLRKAASLMRERAEAATDDVCPQWTYSAVRHIARNCEIECYHEDDDPAVAKYHDADGWANQWVRYDDAPHIASWHPAVALAVADWLESEARALENFASDFPDAEPLTSPDALAVARAYLGSDA